MSEYLCMIIWVCCLVVTLTIFLYTALVLRHQYRLVKIDLEVYKRATLDLKERVVKLLNREGERIKRVEDVLKTVDKVLELNDEVIRDNHQLSNELAALRLEIRRGEEEEWDPLEEEQTDWDPLAEEDDS